MSFQGLAGAGDAGRPAIIFLLIARIGFKQGLVWAVRFNSESNVYAVARET